MSILFIFTFTLDKDRTLACYVIFLFHISLYSEVTHYITTLSLTCYYNPQYLFDLVSYFDFSGIN